MIEINVETGHIVDKMRAAYLAALKSTDRSTKIGAVLVDSGWNVVTRCNSHITGYGDEPSHHERPLKYQITEHAERAVILEAARQGIKTEGLTLVANWVCCPDCARAIVLAGIRQVISHRQCMDRNRPEWKPMIDTGLEILRRGGVELIVWDGVIGDIENLNGGQVWRP
jgi:dCMP deaminase